MLLIQGRFASIIRRHPEINSVFADSFKRLVVPPFKTGALAQSVEVVMINGRHAIEFGPKPFDRSRAVARLEGREAIFLENRRRRNPRGGRPRVVGFYGVPANVTSRQPEWIEKGIIAAAEPTVRLIQQIAQTEVEAEDLFNLATLGRRR